MSALRGRDIARAAALLLMLSTPSLLSGCLLRAAPGQTPLVGEVRIVGNHAISTGAITNRLALISSGFQFLVRIGGAYPYDPELVRIDRLRIERVYQAFGYYSAKVVDVTTKPDKGRIDITFEVEEGPPSRVEHLTVNGLEALPDDVRQALLKRLPLAEKDVFSEDVFDQLKSTLQSRLKEEGYWEAAVAGHTDVDPARQTADVRLDVHPGRRYTLSTVTVTGTKDVSIERILDASRLRPGDLLRPTALSDAQHRIAALAVFSQIQVKPGELDRAAGKAPITIEVAEAPFQTVATGVGIEVDQTQQLARVKAAYTHKNLARDLEKIIVSGSLGYTFLPTFWAFIGPETTTRDRGIVGDLTVQYIQPRVFRWPIDAQASVGYTKSLTPAFDYQKAGAQAGLIFHVDPLRGFTFAPSVHYDYYFDVSSGPPQPTIPGQPPATFATSGCGPNAAGVTTPTCQIAYFEGRLNYDLRDDPLSPRLGAFFSIIAQYAGTRLSDFNYFQFSPEARVYFPAPFTDKVTIAGRLHAGWLRQVGGGRAPPGVARFFAGGPESVRIEGIEQLGPREFIVLDNPNTGSAHGPTYLAGTPVPVGGDTLLEGSVEIRWRSPWENLGFAVFFDIGSLELLANNSIPNTSGGFQYGPGIGVRYHTPFGPLRLDIAYRVSALDILPVSVDTTNATNVAQNHVPLSVLGAPGQPPNYQISSSCKLFPGQQSYQCFADSAFQFFITLGEAF